MKKQHVATTALACMVAASLMVGAAYSPQTNYANSPDSTQAAENAQSVDAAFYGESEAVSNLVELALEEQAAQTDAEVKAAWFEAVAQAAQAQDENSAESSGSNKSTSGTTGSSSSSKSSTSSGSSTAKSTRTITIDGVTMRYIDSYGTSSAPSSGAGIWRGSDSTTDGSYSYYIGHNPGSFSVAASASNGSKITVNDSDGNSRTYTVVDTFVVSRDSTWSDVSDRVTSHGESVALQTCVEGGYKIIVAE